MQTTLKKSIFFTGTGLHSGAAIDLRVLPASANYGLWFRRTDVTDRDNLIPARYDAVNDTKMCTRVCNDAGVELSTIEHLMAALAGTGIHNALIEVSGPEVPIMDGSSAPFVAEILRVGLQTLDQPVRAIRILKEVTVKTEDFEVSLSPNDNLNIDFEIDFAQSAIGRQAKSLNMANGSFVRELSNCRTFCSRHEVEALQSMGLGLGGSLENAIVVDQDKVLNPDGFRRVDECVRHKMLDALGDLYLAGAPILGQYRGKRAGHRATNLVLRALFDQPDAYEMIECTPDQSHDLPGADITLLDFVA
ncbi:UDP-3-O-acyl-N-acetylglucosamine deacetylase [Amylibacter marinus]|uniref:UDP-3-O-acyl-N-acetylglucosamine deacetylase n=1 Tax=Amylibacter marinus TaxID=1475483 RepID=A0ABQ5VTZ5_9RHOB|nr:UDP-3-O-acyl-N-acetylglucosamine deacetylase [Amylibacter marinus]GLQ34861.1 UDP-3-O-acyl-N-acetylglucosamine deacetylase [Amylibacter marinus]